MLMFCGTGGRNSENAKIPHYSWSSTVLSETWVRLVLNVDCKMYDKYKQNLNRRITDILREERQCNLKWNAQLKLKKAETKAKKKTDQKQHPKKLQI